MEFSSVCYRWLGIPIWKSWWLENCWRIAFRNL